MGIKIQKRKFIRNIFIGIIGLAIVAYIINIAPGYKRDKFKDVTNLVIGEKNVTEELKNPIYIDENETIYFDEANNMIIITSEISVASMTVGEKNIKIDGAIKDTLDTIIYVNDIMYIPISEVKIKDVYNIELKYITDKNVVIIDKLNEGMIKARAEEQTKIRFKQRNLSKKVGILETGDVVSAFYTTSKGWRQIRTEDGTIGYVKANVLSDEHILRQDMNQTPETKEIIASTQDNEILTIERRKYCNKRFI